MESNTGIIRSPNYPAPYHKSSDCRWTITTAPGTTIRLLFAFFETLEKRDFVYVYRSILLNISYDNIYHLFYYFYTGVWRTDSLSRIAAGAQWKRLYAPGSKLFQQPDSCQIRIIECWRVRIQWISSSLLGISSIRPNFGSLGGKWNSKIGLVWIITIPYSAYSSIACID